MLSSSTGLLLAACACAAVGCGPSDEAAYPERDCTTTIWAKASRPGATLQFQGSWDGWAAKNPLLPTADPGFGRLSFELPAGEYGYLILEDGVPRLDPYNAQSTYRGEDEVSWLSVPDCGVPEVRVDAVRATDEGDVTLEGSFLAGRGGPALDPSTLAASTAAGVALSVGAASAETGRFELAGSGLSRGKYSFVVSAGGATTRAAAWVRPAAPSFREGLLYQIVVDRFRGDGGAPLAPPATPGSRAGGTLDGVRAEIEKGTFEGLGVTALWLSPVYLNPDEALLGRDGHMSEGYHGYWPLASREVDPRIGGREALTALVASAHAHGLRVLFDLVPNHVYDKNPVYLDHQGDGWFNDGAGKCVCGDPGCGWNDHIQTCWFTPFLPDVRWQDPGAMRAAVDDTVFWATEFDTDGFRLDAVPMMPRAATRRMAHALRTRAGRRDDTFFLGEVFTGGGEDGIAAIRYYLGPAGLDSGFDFPLMWAARDVIAHGAGGFDAIEEVLTAAEEAYRGSGTVQARMLGNHDTTRFLSEANGDAGGDPWSAPPGKPSQTASYARHRMALALLYTQTDMPVVYYGDEVGLAGGADPDCRRVMPALESLPAEQAEVLRVARRLGTLRACSPALRRGARVPLSVEHDTYAYLRDAGDGDPVVVLLSRSAGGATVTLPSGALPPGDYADVMTGETVKVGPAPSIAMAPLSFRVLVPETSPCLR